MMASQTLKHDQAAGILPNIKKIRTFPNILG
jgi:hypothetical protein